MIESTSLLAQLLTRSRKEDLSFRIWGALGGVWGFVFRVCVGSSRFEIGEFVVERPSPQDYGMCYTILAFRGFRPALMLKS